MAPLASTVRHYIDGWLNLVTGLGSFGRDKSVHTRFEGDCTISDQLASDLYHHDSICRIGAACYPFDALRRGWCVEGPDSKRIERELHRLGSTKVVREGSLWGRVYGGCVGLMWIDDGRPLDQPVDRRKGYEIRSIDLYDKRLVQRAAFVTNRRSTTFAEARIFTIVPPYGGQTLRVHRDRLLRFGGALTSGLEVETNAGWDYSIYQSAMRYIRGFNNGYSAVENMIQDASQGVLTIKGLIGRATTPGGKEELAARAEIFDLFRSVTRSVVLDAAGNESYTKIATNFSGVAETLDHFVSMVAAVWEIPVTRLVGTSPAGMNATGESDTRGWYDHVEAWREDAQVPFFDYMIDLMSPGRGNKIKLHKLYQPTEKEAAETDKLIAETDSLRIEDQVVDAEEVRASPGRVGGVVLDPRKRAIAPAPTAQKIIP